MSRRKKKHRQPKTPSIPNYLRKFSEQIDQFVESGKCVHIRVCHDNWCEHLKGGICNCDPTLRKITSTFPMN